MLVKFGAIVTEGSGSLGGHTIQHSKGGMQLRTKPIPRGIPSASQILIRSINPLLQAGWKQLTDAQRRIWNNWPIIHGIFNAHGDHRPLSGHSLWMKYQFGRLIEGLSFLPDPSLYLPDYFGPELIFNGSFDTGNGWSIIGSITFPAGVCSFNPPDARFVYQAIPSESNMWYRIEGTLSYTSGEPIILFWNSFGANLDPITQHFRIFFNSKIPIIANVFFGTFTSLICTWDDLSLKRVLNY
jgi:hypothetical protein